MGKATDPEGCCKYEEPDYLSRYAVNGNRKFILRFQKSALIGLKQSINIPASRQVHPCSASGSI